MALLTMFTGGPTTEDSLRWPPGWSADAILASTAGRRSESSAIRRATGGTDCSLEYMLETAQPHIIVGFALYVSGSLAASTRYPFLLRGATGSYNAYLTLSGGYLRAMGSTASIPFSFDTWNYIEIDCALHNTTGTYVLYQNGVPVIDFAGDTWLGNTAHSWTAAIVRFDLRGTSHLLEDIYILAPGSGSERTDSPLGDVIVDNLVVDSNGAVNGFIGSDGDSVNNYLNVQDPVFTLASYNESNVVGARDMYGLSVLPSGSNDVIAAMISPWGSKVDPGAATLAAVATYGGAETEGLPTGLGAGLTRVAPLILEEAPNGDPLTAAVLGSMEVGVEVQ